MCTMCGLPDELPKVDLWTGKQIVQGIKKARIFVVIVSESAILSPHVKNELNLATSRIKEGLIIMPFKIDDSELNDECKH